MSHKFTNQSLAQAVTSIKPEIKTGNFPNNRELTKLCKEHYISLIDVKNESLRIHDILETAVNLYWFEKHVDSFRKNIYETLTELENLTQRLPTQNWYGGEQTALQQFSTPPVLAFVNFKILYTPALNELKSLLRQLDSDC